MPVLPPTEEIDLSQKRRGDLHEAHAAAQDRGCKAGQVADHAAAEGDDEIAPLDPELKQALAQRGELGKALRRLARLQDDGASVQTLLLESGLQS